MRSPKKCLSSLALVLSCCLCLANGLSLTSKGKIVSASLLSSPSTFHFANDSMAVDATTSLLDNSTFSSSCTSICIRKEIHDLTKQELKNYLNAIKKLMSTPSTDANYRGLSKFEQFFTMHNNMYSHCHGSAHFLPWHRALLIVFEKELQAIDPTVCVPYWDESREASEPWNSIIFSSSYYGSYNQNDRTTGCISDGVFANVKFSDRSSNPKKCIFRNMASPDKAKLYDWNMYNQLAANALGNSGSNSGAFTQYAQQLELYHGVFHNDVGGAMSSDYSNCDPLFYLHHAFVDKTWNDFQVQLAKKNLLQFGGLIKYNNQSSGTASMRDTLRPWTMTIEDVLDVKQVCYVYAAPGEGRNYASQYKRRGSSVSEVALDRSSGYVGVPLEAPPAAVDAPEIPQEFASREFGIVTAVSSNSTNIVLSNGTLLPLNNATASWLNSSNNLASEIIEKGNTTALEAVRNALSNTTAPDISSSLSNQLTSNTGSSSSSSQKGKNSTVPHSSAHSSRTIPLEAQFFLIVLFSVYAMVI